MESLRVKEAAVIMVVLQVLEILTVVMTIFKFLSGMSPSVNMYKTGDTRNVPYFIFLLSTVACIGMLHYGLILDIITLASINALGTLLNAAYTGLYLHVVKDKSRPSMQLSLGVAYLAVLYGYLYTALDTEADWAPILGASSRYINTFLMSLPALELVDNIRNSNVNGMPYGMSIVGLACSISWLLYGLMLDDINIYMPNISGVVVGFAKVMVFQLYGQAPNIQKKHYNN